MGSKMEDKQGYSATAKFLMVSPSKVRPVANLVRNKSYVEAVAILEAMPQKGSNLILKFCNPLVQMRLIRTRRSTKRIL